MKHLIDIYKAKIKKLQGKVWIERRGQSSRSKTHVFDKEVGLLNEYTLAICDNEIERFEEEISAYEKNEIDYENNKNSKLVGKPNFGYVYALHLQLTYLKEQRELIVKE